MSRLPILERSRKSRKRSPSSVQDVLRGHSHLFQDSSHTPDPEGLGRLLGDACGLGGNFGPEKKYLAPTPQIPCKYPPAFRPLLSDYPPSWDFSIKNRTPSSCWRLRLPSPSPRAENKKKIRNVHQVGFRGQQTPSNGRLDCDPLGPAICQNLQNPQTTKVAKKRLKSDFWEPSPK